MCNEYIEFTRVCKQVCKKQYAAAPHHLHGLPGGLCWVCSDSCPCVQFENKNIARGATAVKAVKNAVSAIASMSSGAKGVDDAKGEGAADDMESLASAASTADQAPSESGGDAKTKGPKSPTKVPAGGGVGKKLKTRGDAIAGTNTAGDRNIWIVKPTNNNRGNGIRVFNTFAQIDEHLKKKNHGCQATTRLRLPYGPETPHRPPSLPQRRIVSCVRTYPVVRTTKEAAAIAVP